MSFDYNEYRETAAGMITDYGGAGQIVKKGTTGGKNVSGDVTADTPDLTIDGIVTPLVKYKTSEIDGDSILNGDSWVYWQTDSATEIEVNMQITLNSVTFSIKDINPFSSIDDINLYYKLQLRK